VFLERIDEDFFLSRHWRIMDGNGKLEEVQGPGVIGKFPKVLSLSLFSFSYFAFLIRDSECFVFSQNSVNHSLDVSWSLFLL
jgi:ApaG protein